MSALSPQLPVGFPDMEPAGLESLVGVSVEPKKQTVVMFGRFYVERMLQQTGHSVVLAARDSMLNNRMVALKVSSLDAMFRSKDRVENPVEEIRMHAAIGDNEHIVKLLDHGIDEKERKIWQSLELCTRGDLFDMANELGAMPEHQVKMVARQILCALKAIHSKGLAHMDVSLENFLVAEDKKVKLCDFGMMAQDNGTIKGPRGKVLYMAPEVALNIAGFSGAKADVFSFGVVLYALLTGVLPFEKPQLQDPCYSLICKNEVKKVIRGQRVDNKVSPLAQDLFSRLLCLEANRYTVDEVLRHPWLKP